MSQRIGVGIVGAGIGASHIDAYRELPDLYAVEALCDLDGERAGRVAAERGVPVVLTAYEELLARDLDLIDICTPSNLHFTQAMQALADAGFRFIVLSNQAGIARGMINADDVTATNTRMMAELARLGINVIDVYVCPHHWDDGCACRKPAPGMFFQASRDHLLRLDRTIYVGDDPRDARAASNAECLSILVGDERNTDAGGGVRPALVAETMLEAVPWIVARFEEWETNS